MNAVLPISRGGAVAARVAHNHEVAGSSPAPATKFNTNTLSRGFFYIMDPQEQFRPRPQPIERYGVLFDETLAQDDELEVLKTEVAQLLTQDEFMFTRTDFEKRDCSDWQEEDYIAYGKRLHAIVFDEEPTRLTEEVIERAYILGLGPNSRKIQRPSRFGSLWRFNEMLGTAFGYARGRFQEWGHEEFVAYGKEIVEQHHGKRPNKAVLQAAFLKGTGPSPAVIVDRFGGLHEYYTHLGFPNIEVWSQDDYVGWGAGVIKSGSAVTLNARLLDHLSKRGRGPSAKIVHNKFGSLSAYQAKVAKASVYNQYDELDLSVNNYILRSDDADVELVHNLDFGTVCDHEARRTYLLSTNASQLLELLTEHIDAPMMVDELTELAPNADWRQKPFEHAWDELASIGALKDHLFIINDGKAVFSLLSVAADTTTLQERLAFMHNYLYAHKDENYLPKRQSEKLLQSIGSMTLELIKKKTRLIVTGSAAK